MKVFSDLLCFRLPYFSENGIIGVTKGQSKRKGRRTMYSQDAMKRTMLALQGKHILTAAERKADKAEERRAKREAAREIQK